MREIPNTAIEIQTGLWLDTYTLTIGGNNVLIRKLYSSEGYCFYDKADLVYDEEGNVVPDDEVLPNQRMYMQFCTVGQDRDLNDFVSVPVDPSYEIVSRPSNNEVA